MGNEGSDFFSTWTHQSEKEQLVDKHVKGAPLGQLGNFRNKFRRLHKVAPMRRSERLGGTVNNHAQKKKLAFKD